MFSLRNTVVALGLAATGLFVLLIVAAIAFRAGFVDSYVKSQLSNALDEMGVTMKSNSFELSPFPLKLHVNKAEFNNKKTGAKLVLIENLNLDLSVIDLFALSTIRNVSIDRTDINGLHVWINYDKNGKSNYDGIELLPPENKIRFQYSSAHVSLKDGTLHFNDEVHTISGNARNLAVFLSPDPKRPADSKDLAFLFDFKSDASNFIYDKSELKPVDIKANGKIHENGAEIASLVLKTPVGSSTMSGTVKDWKRLVYDLDLVSTIDLTQASGTFPIGTTIAGIGNFKGKVTGEGQKYKVTGEVTSDSLAASNIRLKALKFTGDADGEGSMYKVNGKAVAELFTFEDFRVEFPTLIGNIRGTGSDFRWFGELQAIALKSPLGTIGSLYIADAVAEYEDKQFGATLGTVRARKFTNDDVNLESIQTGSIRISTSGGGVDAVIPQLTAEKLNVSDSSMRGLAVNSARVKNKNGETTVDADSASVEGYESGSTKLRTTRGSGIKVRNQNGVTDVTAKRLETDEVSTDGSKTNGVSASDVAINYDGNRTSVNTGAVRIAKVEVDAAVLANLNIAGVRLTVREGTVSGETTDFKAGDIDLKGNGKLNDVEAKKPVFVLEPSGRYRASLDMTIGGGLIGSVSLGAARASVVADNDLIELNKMTAQVMDGQIDGNAKIATSNVKNSELFANFNNLDLSKILALQGGRIIPIEGKTNGRAELTFKGTNFKQASGTLTAEVEANAGTGRPRFYTGDRTVWCYRDERVV